MVISPFLEHEVASFRGDYTFTLPHSVPTGHFYNPWKGHGI